MPEEMNNKNFVIKPLIRKDIFLSKNNNKKNQKFFPF